MQNYRIYCNENERAEVMTILRKYNDIVIDNIDPTGFGITIEREDPDTLFNAVLHEIDREVFVNRLQQDRIVTENYNSSVTDDYIGPLD